jgi:hypothetical protein
MVVDGALFWGTDAVPALEALLTTGVDPAAAPAHADAVRRWDAIRASAQRRPGVGPTPPVT